MLFVVFSHPCTYPCLNDHVVAMVNMTADRALFSVNLRDLPPGHTLQLVVSCVAGVLCY